MGPAKSELKDLYDEYTKDPRFEHLRDEGINFVPGSGPVDAKVMIVGEAPGRMENARQQPFIGPAGRVLTDLLQGIELDIYNEVFLTNVVKYWPRTSDRRTRSPEKEEIQFGAEYLLQEVGIIDPIVVALCGRSSINAIFPEVRSVAEVHGKLMGGRYIPLFHPAVILYKPDQRKAVEMGFQMLRNVLDVKEAI